MSAVTGVTATSWLSEPQYNTYHTPDRLIDNDLSTAWVEGADGNGVGESFTITLDDVYKVSGCIIYPGYQKSDEQYLKNSTPASVRLTFSDGSWYDYDLEDVKTGHQLTLPETVETSSLTVTILSVYRGNVYEDTCISEISLF